MVAKTPNYVLSTGCNPTLWCLTLAFCLFLVPKVEVGDLFEPLNNFLIVSFLALQSNHGWGNLGQPLSIFWAYIFGLKIDVMILIDAWILTPRVVNWPPNFYVIFLSAFGKEKAKSSTLINKLGENEFFFCEAFIQIIKALGLIWFFSNV